MQRTPLILIPLLATACQPPPLQDTGEAGLPSLSFIFPQSAPQEEVVYCPDLIVAVDVDNWEVVDEINSETESSRGHWHLRDSAGEYIAVATATWWPVSLGDAEEFAEPTFTVIKGILANHDHNELNTAIYPDAEATLEIWVGAVEGCAGGGGSSDTGIGY